MLAFVYGDVGMVIALRIDRDVWTLSKTFSANAIIIVSYDLYIFLYLFSLSIDTIGKYFVLKCKGVLSKFLYNACNTYNS